jgi:hypothetical protein
MRELFKIWKSKEIGRILMNLNAKTEKITRLAMSCPQTNPITPMRM